MQGYFKLFFVLLFIQVLSFAQDVSFKGYGATGFKMYNRNRLNDYNQETYYEGKVQLEAKYNKEIEIQLDFRGNSTDNEVELHEFSVKLEYWKRMSLKIGNVKKPFGYEYLVNRDELITVDRSYVSNTLGDLGYGSRAVSVMAYYNYDKDDPSFPYSYYISVFKDNSYRAGMVARLEYNFDDDWKLGGNYMYQNKGGDERINSQGFWLDFSLDKKKINSDIGVFLVQDPEEGIIRRLAGEDEIVYSAGVKWTGAYKFDLDNSAIKDIEPVLTLGYFAPDIDQSDNHVLQAIAGINVYLDKDVRLRLNGDLRLTKNEYSDSYSSQNSLATFEIQARF